ncbi:MAG: glycosyltransferase, partial [bacterium]|nr:glycosyltransferase [bacterium]
IVMEKRLDGYDLLAKELSFNFKYRFRRFRWDLFLIYDFITYCINNKIDIIMVWDGMSAFYGFFTSLFTKAKFINYSIQEADPRLSYRHIIQRMILKLSRNVIANQYAGLKIYGVEKKGKVIYNGLDFSRFKNSKKTRNDDKFVIGIVANLTEYKDYYTFLGAIKILQEKINNLEVHIIGWGRLAEDYKNYAIKIGVRQDILKYFGRVSNVEDLIPNFDVGVLCSYKEKGEGLSNSVLEYMACGVPPIITDIGAAREIIEPNVTGLLFEAGNPKELADKILELFNNTELRYKIGNNAKLSVFKKFDYDRYLKEIEDYIIRVHES